MNIDVGDWTITGTHFIICKYCGGERGMGTLHVNHFCDKRPEMPRGYEIPKIVRFLAEAMYEPDRQT